MQLLTLITVISTLCFQCVRPATVCHCIRIKDCAPFAHLLLNHKPEERATVFARINSANCGYSGLDPLACCPQHKPKPSPVASRSTRLNPAERWVWQTLDSPKHNAKLSHLVPRGIERHPHDYRDFHSSPFYEDYDETPPATSSGHHFLYQVEHGADQVKQATRPPPVDKPFVFPGDLRFQAGRDQIDFLADASQPRAVLNETFKVTKVSTVPPTSTPSLAWQNADDCGVSVSTRLVGGDAVTPGQYPWFARIAYRNRTSNQISYRCSGSLITNNHVLTAAHCVVNLVNDLELFQVRIGDDISSPLDCAPSAANCTRPNVFDIMDVRVHPNYDQPKYANDIAVLSLDNSIGKFTPICLPLNRTAVISDRLIGQTGVVAGWSTKAENDTSNSLGAASVRFIRLPVVNTTSCAITYATLSENFQQPIVITPNHLCAQGQPMKDVCRGDSGGPFMDDGTSGILNANGRYTLLGIVAFGPTLCGVTSVPGVYTAVSSYTSWIFDGIRTLLREGSALRNS